MANNINIAQETLDFITKKIEEKIDQATTKTEIKQIINWDEVVASAKAYLSIINYFKQDIKIFEQNLKQMGQKRKGLKKQVYSQLEEYVTLQHQVSNFLHGEINNIPQQLYQAAIQFSLILNTKLGQKIKSIIVIDDGEQVSLREFNIQEALKYNYTSGGKNHNYHLNAAISLTKEQIENTKRILEKGLKDNQVQYLQFLYRDLSQRYEIGKYRRTHRIFWINPYPGTKWKKRKVQSKGSLNQAYADLILARSYNQYAFFIDYRQDIDTFMEKQLDKVDNQSGLFAGDVVDADFSAIQYAIKSLNASFMHINSLQEYANRIIGEEGQQIEEEILSTFKTELEEKKHSINKASEKGLKSKARQFTAAIEQEKYEKAMELLIG